MDNMLEEYTTLTGMTFKEVLRKMGEVLPPKAYKEIVGQGIKLTDIDPHYLTPVIITCFGMPGVGWWYDFDESLLLHEKNIVTYTKNNQEKQRTVYSVGIPKFSLYFMYKDSDGNAKVSDPVISTGGSENRNISYAMKGALTNALSQAFARLLWQLHVYQGKLHFANAAQKYKAQQEKSKGTGDVTADTKPDIQEPEQEANVTITAPSENVDNVDDEIPEEFDRTKRGEEPVYSIEWAKKVLIPSDAGTIMAGKTLGEAAKDSVLGPSVLNYLAGYVYKADKTFFDPNNDPGMVSVNRAAKLIMESGEVKDLRTKKRKEEMEA